NISSAIYLRSLFLLGPGVFGPISALYLKITVSYQQNSCDYTQNVLLSKSKIIMNEQTPNLIHSSFLATLSNDYKDFLDIVNNDT
ncbi:MAG: hypothetical protein OEM02_09710, partial [Desulfobulbaceae bacterium]|nr:hypothetical protein [Desulfobulbaceae bacterium]